MVTFHPKLADLLIPIDRVTQHPDNPNNGDVEAIVESIEFNGYVAPVIVQESTGYIVAGNHRYQALLALGSKVIPAIFVDMDETAAQRYLLADNRIAALAVTDNAKIVDILEGLDEQDSLRGTGYTKMDLTQLSALLDITPSYDEFASWPTLSLTVPPHLKNAFYQFTAHAVSDHDRLEMLLRLAGWQEEK
jgi:ParB-like chromosome segregation protein Spo0J